MQYCDLSGVLETYANGGNVTEYLRRTLGQGHNDDSIIEIAYDLQAGSYVEYFEKNRAKLADYIDEISALLKPCLRGSQNVLDVGTGECTTLAGVATNCFGSMKYILGCDISWSRLYVGRQFAASHVPEEVMKRLKVFVCTLFSLPLQTKSIDIVWTSHAIEPNGGREREALAEIFRIAKNKVCLFEPNYEANTSEGKQRMERLGYVRNLPEAIHDLGGVLEDCIRIKSAINPLNPTYAFVITPPEAPEGNGRYGFWACPSTGYPVSPFDGFMYCERSGLAYPLLLDIPVLRKEAAILATALRKST